MTAFEPWLIMKTQRTKPSSCRPTALWAKELDCWMSNWAFNLSFNEHLSYPSFIFWQLTLQFGLHFARSTRTTRAIVSL